MTENTLYIVKQLFSGRWIATVVIVAVYAYCAVIGLVPSEGVMSVTMLGLGFYFHKEAAKKNGG